MNVPLLDLKAQYAPLRKEIRAAIDGVLDEQQLILGKTVLDFESELASYCKTKFALAVSSGTDALLASLMALDIKAGDEVICPAFTFFATAGSIARAGATPVFVDIEPRTFNIDIAQIESKITAKTRAIMPVHLYGQLAPMEQISSIARKHNLHVIEDGAQAIGAKRAGKMMGVESDVACLSFYPTKNLGALGDAGAILTNDEALFNKLKKIRVHGSGHTYFHEMIGGMFRMAAVQAAALSVKLKHLDRWNARRRENAHHYNELFARSNVVVPFVDKGNEHVYHQYIVRVPNRDAVKEKLTQAGIGCAVFYPLGLHMQQCFSYLGYKDGQLPETERATREVLALPIYPELSDEHVEYVGRTLLKSI